MIGLHTALDDIPAEGLSGQISPSPIVILLGEVSTPLSLGFFSGVMKKSPIIRRSRRIDWPD